LGPHPPETVVVIEGSSESGCIAVASADVDTTSASAAQPSKAEHSFIVVTLWLMDEEVVTWRWSENRPGDL
jgi:hypothetical protein